jgi:A/G-specific adenine glycosylase
MNFSETIINWYAQNKRDLPWRKTQNPYCIWLSEVILQQTRVAQGLPYYEKFIYNFPTVKKLAEATEDEVLKLWQGLGYYSRARNLHFTAKMVLENHHGIFPSDYKSLLQLKGIGTYTAAAIASFSSNEDVTVVDGNVFRVLSRVFNVDLDISTGKSKKYFQELADNLLIKGKSYEFNQAIMEFGAMQCVPKNPNCEICVLNTICEAKKLKLVTERPVKLKKVKVTQRFFNYFLIKDNNNNYLVNKRKGKGIWENLHELYLIESSDNNENLLNTLNKAFPLITEIIEMPEHQVVHKLTHQHLLVKFFIVETNQVLKDAKTPNEIKKLAFPKVLENFIEKIGL